MREQPPAGNGTTDIQVVLSLLLTEAEVDKVVLDPQEYAALQVFLNARAGVPRAGEASGNVQRFYNRW
jgi:hypothetical protein